MLKEDVTQENHSIHIIKAKYYRGCYVLEGCERGKKPPFDLKRGVRSRKGDINLVHPNTRWFRQRMLFALRVNSIYHNAFSL